ncbi:C39 family peptidase [Neobacillus dielmonensis]|uniref:C39 family peptidase n=1 Tax=Neobacillus dielmonensis TaxID=1347369 RepID=UPI000ACB81FD|nr:C39 family peptidase [Neobacillus dielmonensis]
MKQKVLLLIILLGILTSVGYVGVQKTVLSSNATNNKDITEQKQDQQKLTEEAAPASDVSQASSGQVDNTSQDETRSSTEEQTTNVTLGENGKFVINDVPLVQQLPELSRGCEVTSLTMMLQYAGVSVDKLTLAKEITSVPFRYQSGLKGNPNEGFVGDIYSFNKSGYGVYHAPIAALAEKYLPGKIVDMTGQDIHSIYKSVEQGNPVWVITNSRFSKLPESEFSTWNTPSGQVKITYREHSVLILGYDNNYVYVNDPLTEDPYKAISRESFEASWAQMGSQAISYKL